MKARFLLAPCLAPLAFETCVRATTKTLSVAPMQATITAN